MNFLKNIGTKLEKKLKHRSFNKTHQNHNSFNLKKV